MFGIKNKKDITKNKKSFSDVMREKKYKKSSNNLFKVQDEIKSFQKTHKGKLNERDRAKIGKLLNRRAKAMSGVLGVEVGSIAKRKK